ncbi:GntR family transcriptional regulator [Streptomyces sp. NPDC050560]|uniref:GntR family transcriptional regulator n=1 Tax=Streptomyces sp. NPDC050560 TaxID=3365630 RepID=UPI0037AEC2FF
MTSRTAPPTAEGHRFTTGHASIGETVRQLELSRTFGRGGATPSIADDIALAVATEIIEGRLSPGDDLNSVELARSFDSSRTPVREALLVLEREGFVEITARRRPRVARLLLREVRELYNLRAELYALVSRAVVREASQADLETLRGHQRGLDAAVADDDVDRYFWINVQFRNTEAAIARDATLRRVLDSLGARALQLRHLSLSQPGRLDPSAQDHARLLRAYEDRDAELAAALTQSLVRAGLAAIERSGWTGEAP